MKHLFNNPFHSAFLFQKQANPAAMRATAAEANPLNDPCSVIKASPFYLTNAKVVSSAVL